ncbi:alpha/beta hydrolase [Streptomyces griseorubiginosus]|uniref:alpha/beta hydrolase n=1 Tax=Streptomyces griseorubiginosus TaxID=67304 RepID=UPI001AD77264|nr:alpha/beta hydrolase [Streptomyces griseorubiginosus]MBO4253316.1 alpha/beta hydrolase fold domain-containing protein [Streptomyces griseorubiginosus]
MSEISSFDYVSDGDPRQRLDVFTPDPATDLHTAVLVLHGGAFRLGDRSDVHTRCRALAARGITAIAVGYRLLDSAVWPAQLDDARAALRWTHEHAHELGIDAGRIVLQGHSAGAQLALLVAGTADRDAPAVRGDTAPVPVPAAVIAYYPPAALSLTPGRGDLPAQPLLGPDATADATAAVSPINHVDEHFPPTILIHGTRDRFIPPVSSLRLFDALTAAEVVGELHLIAGQDHEFDTTPRFTESSLHLVVEFLRAQVVEPEQVAKEVLEGNPLASMPPPGGEPGRTGEHA